MRYFVGIDPGITGAIALVGDNGEVGMYDTPSFKVQVGGRERDDYDLVMMAKRVKDLLYTLQRYGKYHIGLEQVGVMPTDGRVGAFSFGKGYGAWQMALTMANLSFSLISPLRWKPYFGLLGGNKTESIVKAKELFPTMEDKLTRLKDHNRADALLIAAYVRDHVTMANAADTNST